MNTKFKAFLFVLSCAVVAFGQPAWSSLLGIVAACCGYALFWRLLLEIPERKKRFWTGVSWFSLVSLIQLSWLTSHPFYYIYFVLIAFAFMLGVQFGILCLFIEKKQLQKISQMVVIAAVWTLMEWVRLFFFAGYTWNPVGLALAGNDFSAATASLFGSYGLSFWVILTNLFVLRAWIQGFSWKPLTFALIMFALPFLYGGGMVWYHSRQMEKDLSHFRALLVQTAYPVEETQSFSSHDDLIAHVTEEWKGILKTTEKHQGKFFDLVALPELVVPFGTYSFIYHYDTVKEAFVQVFGEECENCFPKLELPFAYFNKTKEGEQWLVNNAFWAQALSNMMDAGLVIGLEDAQDVNGHREYYSAAFYFNPQSKWKTPEYIPTRYEKRVLVTMGEYIPFEFCRQLAGKYGVVGSFTPGEKAQVWEAGTVPFGISICYEEMFGDLMRENREKGAQVLLNITSDAWFPHSKLVRQHLEHSRLRTYENGIPLVRSCNTGITCAIDALGRDVAVLGENDKQREDLSDALQVDVPLYHYQTLYSRFGDGPIIGFSLLAVLLFFCSGYRPR